MPRVFVTGSVAWNQMIDLDRFPEPRSQTIFPLGARRCVGGSGAGKALNLAALGLDVTLHAYVGEDGEGRAVREELEAAGVRCLFGVDPAGTQRHVNLMTPEGGRMGIFVQPPSPDLPVDLDALAEAMDGCEDVVLGISPHCRAVVPLLDEEASRIWVDVHDWDGRNSYHRPFAERGKIFLMSHVAVDDCRPILEERIRGGAELAVCSRGEEGLVALDDNGGWHEVQAEAVSRVVDTNGAGDALMAGMLFARSRGMPWTVALRMGALCGARAVMVERLADPGMDGEALLRSTVEGASSA